VIPAPALWHDGTEDAAAAVLADAARLGGAFDTTPIAAAYPAVGRTLRDALLVVRVPGGTLALHRVGRRRAVALGPDRRRHRLATSSILDATTASIDPVVDAEVDDTLAAAGIDTGARRDRARRALLDARLVDRRVELGWRVGPTTSASWRQLARSARLGRWAGALVIAHLATYAVFLATFAVVGGDATSGTFDATTVVRGSILLLSSVPLRMLGAWSAGRLTIGAGGLLRDRLLAGILAVEPDDMRHAGAGHHLGTVLEAEAVETLALSGGHNALLAVLELLAAIVALASGTRGLLLVVVLVAWVAAAVALARTYRRRRAAWSADRVTLTHELIERVVGHRTRLVQEGPALHDRSGDELAVARYGQQALAMDRAASALHGGLARSWVLIGLALLLLSSPGDADPISLAAAFGGVLLAFHGLDKLAASAASLIDASVAWHHLQPLLQAAPAATGSLTPAGPAGSIEVRDLGFSRGGRSILTDVNLTIRLGDRVLLEGPSGSGKSTLAALLAEIRPLPSGTIAGSSSVALVPQFHENHLLSASLAFNLLVGRRWPPTDDDLTEAWQVCEELGLGPLLARMPSGIEQPVGECGWQLSHGERSRVFVARALLQPTGLVVLDESLAALDPEALRQTLETVLRRAPAVMVIAHG